MKLRSGRPERTERFGLTRLVRLRILREPTYNSTLNNMENPNQENGTEEKAHMRTLLASPQLQITCGRDGVWLHFKAGSSHAVVNLETLTNEGKATILSQVIKQWIKLYAESCKTVSDDRGLICDIISVMLDNADGNGIYPTAYCYGRLEQLLADARTKLLDETMMRLRDMVKIQGRKGNWDYDEYMRGMYNGMELMLATIENREPDFKEGEAKKSLTDDKVD